jgi:NAD(P)H-hydrate epimerase
MAAEVEAIDRRAEGEFQIPARILMENAGRQAARFLIDRIGPGDGEVLILAGHGHNGGDGLVAARYLALAGVPVRVVIAPPVDHLKPLTAENARILRSMGIVPEVRAFGPELLSDRGRPRAVIEALFGSGARGGVPEGARALFAAMAEKGIPGLAMDNPAGLDIFTGVASDGAFPATWTLALALPKPGQILARRACGELFVAEIGFPRALINDAAFPIRLTTPEQVRAELPPRDPMAHKGMMGHLLVVAGSTGKSGAAALAAQAAVRSGAGLVTLACPAATHAALEEKTVEVMTLPLPDHGGRFRPESLPPLLAEIERYRALAVGPGIGTGEDTADFVRELLAVFPGPAVIDADGLTLLARERAPLFDRGAATVLTPHPGEAARLLSRSIDGILRDPIGAAVQIAHDYRSIAVLKSATTVVASPDGRVRLNTTGNPGMASGGMGDLLTGVIGALLARGLAPFEAAATGVFLHGLAGDIAAASIGEVSLAASDLLPALGEAFADPARARMPVWLLCP